MTFTCHSCVQVAIIAGNFDLAEIIKIHKTSDVGELKYICHMCVVNYPYLAKAMLAS